MIAPEMEYVLRDYVRVTILIGVQIAANEVLVVVNVVHMADVLVHIANAMTVGSVETVSTQIESIKIC